MRAWLGSFVTTGLARLVTKRGFILESSPSTIKLQHRTVSYFPAYPPASLVLKCLWFIPRPSSRLLHVYANPTMEPDHQHHAPRRTMSAKRASMRPLDVRRILADQGASEARPSPADYVAAPPSPSTSQHSAGSSGRTSFQSHGRTLSMASVNSSATSGRPNRFSMQFPIQLATREQSPHRPTSSPTKDSAHALPDASNGPSDTNFLTAIAAQERRVLELKEELQRAETELKKLKKSWANHEVYKKKNDVRMLAKLEPVTTAPAMLSNQDADNGAGAWLQQEMERRKALLSGTRTSSRTVFSGSRHTRTLSLLSPTRAAEPTTPIVQHPPRQDSLPAVAAAKGSAESERPPLQQSDSTLSGVSSTPDMTNEVARSSDIEIDLTQANVDREVLIKQGRKMASDFKDGLWNFFEDLRQATVGDEATQTLPPTVRRQISTQTLKSNYRDSSRASRGSTASKASTETRRPHPRSPVPRTDSPAQVMEEPSLIDTAGTFWTEAGLPIPEATPAPIKKSSKHSKTPSMAPSIASSMDAWDTWDDNSPKVSRSSSSATSESVTQASTSAASPRHFAGIQRNDSQQRNDDEDVAEDKEKEPIPWPALSKLKPTSLRRTASHLMSEWEKSMTPEPGQEFRGEENEFAPLPQATEVCDEKRD